MVENVTNEATVGVEEGFESDQFLSNDFSPETMEKLEDVIKKLEEDSNTRKEEVTIFL